MTVRHTAKLGSLIFGQMAETLRLPFVACISTIRAAAFVPEFAGGVLFRVIVYSCIRYVTFRVCIFVY